VRSQGWREDTHPHFPPGEHTFVSDIFTQMGLTKFPLQPAVSPHEIPPWKTGVSRQSKVPNKGSKPPKPQIPELIHSKRWFKLPQKRSLGIAKRNQFTAAALLACVFIPLDKNISQVHSP